MFVLDVAIQRLIIAGLFSIFRVHFVAVDVESEIC